MTLQFIHDRCEGLGSDPAANEEEADLVFTDASLKPNQIPYNMQMDINRLCLEREPEEFIDSGVAEDAHSMSQTSVFAPMEHELWVREHIDMACKGGNNSESWALLDGMIDRFGFEKRLEKHFASNLGLTSSLLKNKANSKNRKGSMI